VTGSEYKFRVSARNEVGLGDVSGTVIVLVAQPPGAPQNVQTILSGDFVIITWGAPQDGGSAIQGYSVFIRRSDQTTYL